MKKIVSVFLAALLCALTFSACGHRGEVRVNGTPIANGVRNYFMDAAESELPDGTEDEIQALAYRQIARYVAINSAFAERDLALRTEDSAAVSQEVNALWRLFSGHYEAIEVTKQDLLLVKTSERCAQKVMEAYYAADGDAPVGEETLQAYFNENYVAFQAITGFLTTADDNGNAVAITGSEKEKLLQNFTALAEAINSGSSVAEQAHVLENTTANTETVVVHRNDSAYPAGFFEAVSAIENNRAGMFSLGDYVFAVQREDLNDAERNLFARYRLDCLRTLKGAEFKDLVESWADAYTVEER